MSYQTIFKRLMMLNQTRSSQTFQDHYNMQVSLFQEMTAKLTQYQNRETTSKLQVETSQLIEKNTPYFSQKDTSARFLSQEQIFEILKNCTNLEQTKKDYIALLYQDALFFNELSINTQDQEEKKIYKGKIQEILQNIKNVKNYTPKQKTQKENTSLTKNQLIFLEQSNHRITILEELQKEIPISLYPDFLVLLSSLENGTLKGYKNLTAKSFDQVSTKFARVFFYKLNRSDYLVLSAIQKNFYSQKHYREKLNRLENIIKNESSYYLDLLNQEQFIFQQNIIRDQIYSLLRKREL